MRIPLPTTVVLLLTLLPGAAGVAMAQEGAQDAASIYDWEEYKWNSQDSGPKKKDPIKVEAEAAKAQMEAAQKFLAAGEKDRAVAAQQSALRHLLKARALKKDDKKDGKAKKGKDKKEEKKPSPPPTLADALETFAQGQEALARRIAGRAANDGERAEHHGLTGALDTLANATVQDWKLSVQIRQGFRALQEHGHAADAAIAAGATDGAVQARGQAAEARTLVAMIRAANDLDLAKQLDQMRQQLEEAAGQLEKNAKQDGAQAGSNAKPGAEGTESKDSQAKGNDAKEGGQSKGNGESKDGESKDGEPKDGESKDADAKGDPQADDAEKSRQEAARKVEEVGQQLDAVTAAKREGLSAMKAALAQAKAGENLKRLAEAIPQSGSKQEDAKHAKELRAAAQAMGRAAETLGRSDGEKIASALAKLAQAEKQASEKSENKPGDKPSSSKGQPSPGGEASSDKKSPSSLVSDAAATLADAKDQSVRGLGQYLATLQERQGSISAERLAIIRANLLRKLRDLRAAELDQAKDAPIPGDTAPVSEAYLRALADDLDHSGE